MAPGPTGGPARVGGSLNATVPPQAEHVQQRRIPASRGSDLFPLRTWTSCLAERVPSAWPFSGSRGVNSGHSPHLQPGTRRSALVHVSTLIAARSSKLGFRGDLPGHRGVPAGGGDSPLTLRARAGGGGRRQAVGDGRHPAPDDRDGPSRAFRGAA
jgi:hypothetical protein